MVIKKIFFVFGVCSIFMLGIPETTLSKGSTSPTSSTQEITFENPLKFNTVDDVLSNVLKTVQGIVGVLALVFIVIGGIIYITSAGNSGRTELAKKAIGGAIIGLALAFAAPSLLKEIYGVLQATNVHPDAQAALSLSEIAMKVLKVLLGFVGTLSVLMLVIGGIIYMSSAGDDSRIDLAKKTITYAIIGLVVALASLVIVNAIAGVFAH